MVRRDDIPGEWQLWCCAENRKEAEVAAEKLRSFHRDQVVIVDAIGVKKLGGYRHGKRKDETE
jgi:hypothetical protein